jgi:hypothetical protein
MENLYSNIEKHLHKICLFPSRHVGSPGNAAAAEYIENTFRSYGYTETGKELIDTTGWRYGSMTFADLDNGAIPVPGALPCFFSRSTDVSGVPLWLTEEELKDLSKIDVRGKLCIVEFFSDGADIRGRNGIAEDLDSCGAAGAVFISDSDYHTCCAASTKIQRSPYLKQLGTAVVSEVGAYYLANNKNHRYRLIIDADTFPHKSANVYAIRPGTGPKRAIFGAHHDAAPLGQAACDNASGVACILELSRLLKDKMPEWTFEFVSFDAEEYCIGSNPVGSDSFVKAHPERKWEFFMNFDSVGMHFGRDYVHVDFPEKLPEFDSIYPKKPFKDAGDDRSFHCIGVPSLWFNTHAKFKDFHTPLDSIDTLDLGKIETCIKEAVRIAEKLC